MYIVAIYTEGSVTFHGPFPTHASASEWAEANYPREEWLVIELSAGE